MNSYISNDETSRLEALKRYNILDTDPEQAFDDFTLLASQICETPIALITLLDETRQWFKSKVGLPTQGTPRDIAFCEHAIQKPEIMVVKDALTDDRFATNPLVTADPHIRFYAGAPLISPDGYGLGTLCVIDRVPRDLTKLQATALQALSRQVVTQLELRHTSFLLSQTNRVQEKLIGELEDALARIESLEGIIPICSNCKKIRDDEGFWEQVDSYITKHSKALFSHSICPDCAPILYPDYFK